MMITNPSFKGKHLCFDNLPFHIGTNFNLVPQSYKFENETETKYNEFSNQHNKTDILLKRLIICDKNQFTKALRMASKLNHISFITISDDRKSKISEKDIYIILLLVVSKKINKSVRYDSKHNLNQNMVSYLKKMKEPNVHSIKGTKHNLSYGKYYGYGLTNKYKPLPSGLTFGCFKRKNDKDIETNAYIEQKIRFLFNNSSMNINSSLPGTLNAGNNSINSLIAIGRNTSTNTKFKDATKPTKFGVKNNLYHSIWLCENARTELFHQELDASYTMISVPPYDLELRDKSITKYKFQFRWNVPEDNQFKGVNFILDEGTSLYYNGFGLFHRQIPNQKNYDLSSFWNLSMYHNKRLWYTIFKSIEK